VHYWLLKQIKMYNDQMKRLDHASITMGGCLYIVCRVINNMNNEAQDRCADETIQGQPPHVPNDDEFLQMGQQ